MEISRGSATTLTKSPHSLSAHFGVRGDVNFAETFDSQAVSSLWILLQWRLRKQLGEQPSNSSCSLDRAVEAFVLPRCRLRTDTGLLETSCLDMNDVLVALIIVPPEPLNRPNFSMNMTPALFNSQSPLDKRPRTEATPLTLVLEVPHLIRLSRGLSTLPDELLMAVFCWADGADEIFIPSTQYHGFETPIRILISLMCKHWAQVAWNSLIWRRVNTHIGASTTYAPRIESMLRFLQRGPANSELQIKMSAPKTHAPAPPPQDMDCLCYAHPNRKWFVFDHTVRTGLPELAAARPRLMSRSARLRAGWLRLSSQLKPRLSHSFEITF
ncbi:hypothetical protein B0H14DRAFT_2591242 [Mycena olivaceomarginata]|nr:hypothetical protein B0H14DRAFT_2617475 [Mycena olivaceomarginata]KAJ7833890.1 hypothetical protein B0H14DRAFT_2591242 [Mycena olivaceomarginata]